MSRPLTPSIERLGLDAERVARMEFPSTAHGYDKDAVRAFLGQLAEEMRAFKRASLAANRRSELVADELKATVDGLLAVAEGLESELSALGEDLQVSSQKIAGNVRDLQQRMERRLSPAQEAMTLAQDPLSDLVDSIERRERPRGPLV